MKVLVWRYHGVTDVFCAESSEQILKIAKMVLDTTDADWWATLDKDHRKSLEDLYEYAYGRDDDDDVSDWHIGRIMGSLVCVADVERESGDDAFQEFYFTTVTY